MKQIYFLSASLAVFLCCFSINVNATSIELLDVTHKIINPGFESDLNGWNIQNGVFTDLTTMAPVIATNRKKSGTKSINFNTQYGAPFQTECRIYQTVSGLTPGSYRLVAYKCYGRWEAANGIFANGGAGEIKSNGTSSDSNAFIEHSVRFDVDNNGTAIIGGYASSRRGGADRPDFFWLDDFKLYKEVPAGIRTRQMEALDRGLVAVKINNGIFLSWRSLGTDAPATQFNIYRNGSLVNSQPISGATNYIDTQGNSSSNYTVKTLVNGSVTETSKTVIPWTNQYLPIQLNRPSGGTTPDGVTYTYTPNDCSVGDLDGDGEYEIVVKWDPSNSKDNSQSGYTGNVYLDGYKLNGTHLWRIDLGRNIRAGAHYTQFMVYDLDGDGIAEIACRTAPGTIDGMGNYVIMNNDNPNTDYRNSKGYILSGPEYMTVFDGTTGTELSSVTFQPERGSVSSWGDSYGNRVDRFLAAVAYLDGERPSLVMGRGYYTKTLLTAYDYRDGNLILRWNYNSGTSNIEAYGQGNHNLSVADVDNDGKDEIIYGACAIDHDGSFMYRTGLGHGDAMHVSDLDPDRPGLEVWTVHEEKSAAYGYEMHDAANGQIIWGTKTGTDNGRGLAADIDPNHRGFEMWSSSGAGVYDCKGNQISTSKPSINFRIYWDGDLQDEILDGTKLDKWNGNGTNRLFTFYQHNNAKEINTTKANPCLSADILGDWREEVIYYNSADPGQIMIFTTVIPTEHRLYTLMHDPVYRMGVAWQNVAYNQPPHLGFYIGDGLADIPTPDIYTPHASISAVDKVKASARTQIANNNDISYISTENEPEAYYEYDGNIHIISPDATITAIYIYSLNGMILHQNKHVEKKSYEYTINSDDNLIAVKVITTQGAKSFKLTRR